jgi:hypothetical protein
MLPRMNRTRTFIVAVLVLFGLGGIAAAQPTKGKKGKKTKTTAVAKKKPIKKPVVTAEHKKNLAQLMGPYKFGQSKDEVLGVLIKQLDAKYAAQIAATTDVAAQDRLRREKKMEIDRIRKTFIEFTGKKSGWDVSLIEGEFAHNTSESMLVHWENEAGKNQRRFFFFYEGQLYKMFISLDTSILPADKQNFETFKGYLEGRYGPAFVEEQAMGWETGDFHVRAVDKLRSYDALALIIWSPKTMSSLAQLRKDKAPPAAQQDGVIKAVLDKGDQKPGLDENKGTVDAVIKAQGGGGK